MVLLIQGFWTTDAFTRKVVHAWSLGNYRAIADAPYPTIIFRTLGMASAVTVTCMVLAFPYAYFLVRVAGRRLRLILLVATVLPLWVSYLVRVYSWRLILNPDGALNWCSTRSASPTRTSPTRTGRCGSCSPTSGSPSWCCPSTPRSSGCRTRTSRPRRTSARAGLTTLRRVILPLAVPGIAAGSIFTFSLTLGDYIAPSLVGGPGSSLIGTVVFENLGVANNVPFAAAFATVPLAIMAVYLVLMKRLGAFESL